MIIWLIQIGEPLPFDENIKKMRTALLADKLLERGHEVLWWTSAFDHFGKKWLFSDDTIAPISPGLKIHALKGTGYKKNISLSRFLDHRIIARKFRKRAIRMPKPDIIVASLPSHDLAYEAVMFAHKNNIPILVDIRDPWPDLFLEHVPSKLKWLARLILYKDFRMIEETMKKADGIIAVSRAFLEWGLDNAGRSKNSFDRVFYLGCKRPNYLDLSKYEEKFSPIIEKLKSKFIVFFVGAISGAYHSPLILLKAAEKLNDQDIHFVIAGDGEFFPKIRDEAQGFSNVTLLGWLNQGEIEYWLKKSKVGVCPVSKVVNLPSNKAFTYLSAGLPIISAFQGDLREIIEKYQIGFYYPPNDVDALTHAILTLYNNPELYQVMSNNAKRIFSEFFDADKIYDEYAEHIENLARNRKLVHSKDR